MIEIGSSDGLTIVVLVRVMCAEWLPNAHLFECFLLSSFKSPNIYHVSHDALAKPVVVIHLCWPAELHKVSFLPLDGLALPYAFGSRRALAATRLANPRERLTRRRNPGQMIERLWKVHAPTCTLAHSSSFASGSPVVPADTNRDMLFEVDGQLTS